MRSIQEIQLSAIFKQFKVADFAYAILGDLTLQDLLNLALSKNKQVAFRASWLLETIVLKEKIHLNKIHKELILQLPIQYNWSCLRSYTKVCMQLTSKLEKDITLTAVEEEILIKS